MLSALGEGEAVEEDEGDEEEDEEDEADSGSVDWAYREELALWEQAGYTKAEFDAA